MTRFELVTIMQDFGRDKYGFPDYKNRQRLRCWRKYRNIMKGQILSPWGVRALWDDICLCLKSLPLTTFFFFFFVYCSMLIYRVKTVSPRCYRAFPVLIIALIHSPTCWWYWMQFTDYIYLNQLSCAKEWQTRLAAYYFHLSNTIFMLMSPNS